MLDPAVGVVTLAMLAARAADVPQPNACADAKLVRVWVDERSEGGAAAPQPPAADAGAERDRAPYGRAFRLAVRCNGQTYVGVLPPSSADPNEWSSEKLTFLLTGLELTITRPSGERVELAVQPVRRPTAKPQAK